MERIDISVLMAVYKKDNPAFLRESLESIFAQTVEAAEVVLLEDGPLTDALYDVIKSYESRYSTLKVVSYPENRGLGKTLMMAYYFVNMILWHVWMLTISVNRIG